MLFDMQADKSRSGTAQWLIHFFCSINQVLQGKDNQDNSAPQPTLTLAEYFQAEKLPPAQNPIINKCSHLDVTSSQQIQSKLGAQSDQRSAFFYGIANSTMLQRFAKALNYRF
jgi:hypothetical protein